MSNWNEIFEVIRRHFLSFPYAVKMQASTYQVEGPIAIFWLVLATQVPPVRWSRSLKCRFGLDTRKHNYCFPNPFGTPLEHQVNPGYPRNAIFAFRLNQIIHSVVLTSLLADKQLPKHSAAACHQDPVGDIDQDAFAQHRTLRVLMESLWMRLSTDMHPRTQLSHTCRIYKSVCI